MLKKQPPIDCTNDYIMVNECLRQPEAIVPNFSKTLEEKLALKKAKKEYKQYLKSLKS